MRRIRFKPSTLTKESDRLWIAKWLRRARKATKKAIEQAEKGEKVEFNANIWGDLKQFLLDRHFWGKCAYCESRVRTTDFGDAEHYRPKAGITDSEAKPVYCNGVLHRGYYWLAYDWRNLLPACGQCNSGEGKMNQFPIAAGRTHVMSHREARYPAALDAVEEPKLLHPYYHDPAKYLVFGEDGTVAAAPGDKSGMGAASIAVYNLTRGDLETTRKEYQDMAWGEFLKAFSNETSISKALDKYKSGSSPYSLACLQYVELKFKQRRDEYLAGC